MNYQTKNLTIALTAVAVGATAMYWLDPRLGKQRRKTAQDRGAAVVRRGSRYVGTRIGSGAKRLSDRFLGRLAQARSRRQREEVADDEILCNRVRSRLGHLQKFQGRVHAEVKDGCAVLSGSAPPRVLDQAVRAARSVPGVTQVNARMVRRERDPHPGPLRRIAEALRSD